MASKLGYLILASQDAVFYARNTGDDTKMKAQERYEDYIQKSPEPLL